MKSIQILRIIFTLLVGCSLSCINYVKAQNGKSETEADSLESSKEKLYRDVITDDAKSMEGLLTVHEVERKYYFEINDSIFGRDIMAITRIFLQAL